MFFVIRTFEELELDSPASNLAGMILPLREVGRLETAVMDSNVVSEDFIQDLLVIFFSIQIFHFNYVTKIGSNFD